MFYVVCLRNNDLSEATPDFSRHVNQYSHAVNCIEICDGNKRIDYSSDSAATKFKYLAEISEILNQARAEIDRIKLTHGL